MLGVDRLIRPALEAKPVAYFTPTYKMLTEIWATVSQVLKPVTARQNVQQHRLELITGGIVDMWSLDSADAPRGRKYARVVLDEAAMVPALETTWQTVIRPTLADLSGDAWFLSTPRGMNYFHTLFVKGQDTQDRDWASWQMPTASNPHIKQSEIDAMAADMPERMYAQEILAQFLADGVGVFRGVQDAATATYEERQDGHQYVIGADWGRSQDFTVFTVLDVRERRMVALDRSNQVEYALQRERLAALHARYQATAIVAETNAMGEPIIEQLRRDHLPVQPFTTTNATKAAIIDGLALAFERRTVRILPDPILLNELQAFTSERLPSGLVRYSAPSGMHDDCVMSLALALYGADQQKLPFAWLRTNPAVQAEAARSAANRETDEERRRRRMAAALGE